MADKALSTLLSSILHTEVDAAKMGASLAGSSELEELLVDTLHEVLPFNLPVWAKLPWIRDYLEPLVLSAGLMLVCRLWPDKVPQAKALERIAYLASASKWEEVSRPAFRYVRRFADTFIKRLKSSGLEGMLQNGKEATP